MNIKDYKICSKTVMDTTDPNITFNEQVNLIIIQILFKIFHLLGKMMDQNFKNLKKLQKE